MRECSKQQHSLNEGDKDTVWRVTPSHRPCRWPSLLAAPLPQAHSRKSLFGTGFTIRLLSGFLVVHARHHHQQSLSCHHCRTHQPPPSPSIFSFVSSISRILLWEMPQWRLHLPKFLSAGETQWASVYQTSDMFSALTCAFHIRELANVPLKSALKYVITPLKTSSYHLFNNNSERVEVVT